ncbi:MAG: hypothetical protein IJF08_04405 [Clostridia bacterium]|nr:hypothetical protein [Clostridia bacterium]
MKRKSLAAVLFVLMLICALASCGAPKVQLYESIRENPVSPVPIVCQGQGELAEGVAQAERYLAPAQSVADYIYQCLLAEQSEIDLSDYGIVADRITLLYTEIMNTHPDLFFVDPGISYTYNSAGFIVSLIPSYRLKGEALDRAREDCARILDEICAGVDPAWSDFEISLYLHDYLCLHFEYDTDYEIYDMHQFLTLGKGVCQAYTLTYMELLSRYGIKSDVAISQSMNHIWNIIMLGGKPYHVDVTWDDPVPDARGRALHANFLRSDGGIAATEHYGWESDYACTSDVYERTFVTGVEHPFSYTAGKWFFADGKERAVFAADFSTMRTERVLEIEQKWQAEGGGSYYIDAFVGVGTYRGNLIYNLPDRILAHNLQSGVTVEVQIPALGGKQIFGLCVVDEVVHYAVSDAPDSEMQYLSCDITDLADYLWGDADQNGVVDGRDITAILRYVEGLPTTCHTGAADLDDNGATDARDADILRRYLVENN